MPFQWPWDIYLYIWSQSYHQHQHLCFITVNGSCQEVLFPTLPLLSLSFNFHLTHCLIRQLSQHYQLYQLKLIYLRTGRCRLDIPATSDTLLSWQCCSAEFTGEYTQLSWVWSSTRPAARSVIASSETSVTTPRQHSLHLHMASKLKAHSCSMDVVYAWIQQCIDLWRAVKQVDKQFIYWTLIS